MGGYLAKPVTSTKKAEGISSDGNLHFASACMQGWRPKMEDAHKVQFDLPGVTRRHKVEGLFALFDGHGGKEVAHYCSNHLVNALTSISMFKRDEDIGECLRETFMRIDCSLLTKQGQRELRRLRGEDDHVICIHRELLDLLNQQESSKNNQRSCGTASDSEDSVDEPSFDSISPNPMTTEKCKYDSDIETDGTGDSDSVHQQQQQRSSASSQVESRKRKIELEDRKQPFKKGSSVNGHSTGSKRPSLFNSSHPIWERIRKISMERDQIKRSDAAGSPCSTSSEHSTSSAPTPSTSTKRRGPSMNDMGERVSSGVGLEILPKHKAGKHLSNPNMLCINKDDVAPKNPGVDSGCTALVAAIESTDDDNLKRLVVANAGDSRCVLSRNGVAIEMSRDHGLHLQEEQERIIKAGGKISEDGRINGKLNLSRAIGDHQFKLERSKSLKEQMVTSYADIRSTVIARGQDEFMVLACDGIWDAMSSQELVDFVRIRMKQNIPLTEIGEQICHACLARDVDNDPGTDNMSILICSLFS